MTETRIETPRLPDGRTLRLTVAEPERVVRGGLVVLHESRGVTGGVRHLVSSLADEGWLAVAPHIYRGADEVGSEQVGSAVGALSGESVLADADAAFRWLTEQGVDPELIGVVGFELGGSVAMVVAANRGVGAAVSVNGAGISAPLSAGLPALVDIAGELGCPWLGIYGGRDVEINADDVELLRRAAVRSESASDVVHFPRQRDAEPDDVPTEAWERTLNWFDSHLR